MKKKKNRRRRKRKKERFIPPVINRSEHKKAMSKDGTKKFDRELILCDVISEKKIINDIRGYIRPEFVR